MGGGPACSSAAGLCLAKLKQLYFTLSCSEQRAWTALPVLLLLRVIERRIDDQNVAAAVMLLGSRELLQKLADDGFTTTAELLRTLYLDFADMDASGEPLLMLLVEAKRWWARQLALCAAARRTAHLMSLVCGHRRQLGLDTECSRVLC